VTIPRTLIVVLICAFPTLATAHQIGRLFHSPAERSALDAQRKAKPSQHSSAPKPPVALPPTRLDGYVVRSDGRSTLWLNGHATPTSR